MDKKEKVSKNKKRKQREKLESDDEEVPEDAQE